MGQNKSGFKRKDSSYSNINQEGKAHMNNLFAQVKIIIKNMKMILNLAEAKQ